MLSTVITAIVGLIVFAYIRFGVLKNELPNNVQELIAIVKDTNIVKNFKNLIPENSEDEGEDEEEDEEDEEEEDEEEEDEESDEIEELEEFLDFEEDVPEPLEASPSGTEKDSSVIARTCPSLTQNASTFLSPSLGQNYASLIPGPNSVPLFQVPTFFNTPMLAPFTQKQLSDAAKNGKKYVSLKGIVFDIPQCPAISLPSNCYGRDISLYIATNSHRNPNASNNNAEELFDKDIETFGFDEIQRVETFFSLLMHRYKCAVGHIIKGVNSAQLYSEIEAIASAKVSPLHSLIETCDQSQVELLVLRELLANGGADCVNEVCARSGLSPLAKAIECGKEKVCRILIENGADLGFTSALYDGETLKELAGRFGREDIAEML